ncbi:hypothetical protein LTR08_004935 [Meristemomyces frigidus]|nr:hypothetical protein LTR08_004935 [Meristemomyces frigidus]
MATNAQAVAAQNHDGGLKQAIRTVLNTATSGNAVDRGSILNQLQTAVDIIVTLTPLIKINDIGGGRVASEKGKGRLRLHMQLKTCAGVLEEFLRHGRDMPGSNLLIDDQLFLNQARSQLVDMPCRHGSAAESERNMILNHLMRLKPTLTTTTDRHAQQPEAYVLSVEEARQLVEGTEVVEAPVFVTGVQSSAWPLDSPMPPTMQLLSDCALTASTATCISARQTDLKQSNEVSIAQLRDTFGISKHPQHPRTFAGIPSSALADLIPTNLAPEFLRGENCQLLADLFHTLANSSIEEHVRDAIRQHRQACETVFLLADPGAFTLPHYETLGYASWLRCEEGEIGFAWLSHPSDEELDAWRADRNGGQHATNARWRFKVLRWGDSVYFGPGTVHFIFRHRKGSATLATAGRLLRRSDLAVWLKVLRRYVEDTDVDRSLNDKSFRTTIHLLAVLHSLKLVADDGQAKSEYSELRAFVKKRLRAIGADGELEDAAEEDAEDSFPVGVDTPVRENRGRKTRRSDVHGDSSFAKHHKEANTEHNVREMRTGQERKASSAHEEHQHGGDGADWTDDSDISEGIVVTPRGRAASAPQTSRARRSAQPPPQPPANASSTLRRAPLARKVKDDNKRYYDY